MLAGIFKFGCSFEKELGDLKRKLSDIAHSANIAKNSTTVSLGGDLMLTRLYTGQLIVVNRLDFSVAPHLMMDGQWEIEVSQLFRAHIKEDSVVFDIGANTGYFGVIASTEIKSGNVHYFEANPEFIPIIEKTLMINCLREFSSVNNNVVSRNSDGNVQLQLRDDRWGDSFVVTENRAMEKPDKIRNVNTVSIDDYCHDNSINNVDIVKIDVEGYEEEVFYGMLNTIISNPSIVIFMEYTPACYSDDFFGMLKKYFTNIRAIKNNEQISVSSERELVEIFGGDWAMLLLKN